MQSKKRLRRFRVIAEDGLTVHMGNGVAYRFPYFSEFDAQRISDVKIKIHTFSVPVDIVSGNAVLAMEVKAIDDLYWTLQVESPYGEALYRDVNLSDYLYTLPRGIRVLVVSRLVNAHHRTVYCVDVGRETYAYIPVSVSSPSPSSMMLPMTGILCGRIRNSDGVIVRETQDVGSRIVGFLSYDAVVYIDAKDFSDRSSSSNADPMHFHHVHRYRLVNGRGWINALNQGRVYEPNVLFTGHDDGRQKEDAYVYSMPIETKGGTDAETCIVCMQARREVLFLHDDRTGHQVCCRGCADKWQEQGPRCPMCRKDIIQMVRVY